MIREYKSEDREAIEKCIFDFIESERAYIPGFWVEGDVSAPYFDYLVKKISESDGKIFVAELDGQIAGYIAVKIEKDDSPRSAIKKNGYISNVAVLKEYQGKGLGQELIKRAEEFTKENGASHIALDVQIGNSALSLYQKLGYKERSMWMNKKLND